MFHIIDYVATFELASEHKIRFKRMAGLFVDTLEVRIDNDQAFLTTASSLKMGVHKHQLIVDQRPCELIWKWNLWGDPKFIALTTEKKILVKYGDERAIIKIGYFKDEPTSELLAFRILSEKCVDDSVEEISTEDFPLDNRSGSDVIAVQQEITKTVTSAITTEVEKAMSASLAMKFLSVLETEIRADLSQRLAQTIGETITQRQQIQFSVGPGKAVVYSIVWKHRVRLGEYVVMLNKDKHVLGYRALYGLFF